MKQYSLKSMSEMREQGCVSIYMTVSKANLRKNQIQLKKMMFDAEKHLLDLGMSPSKVAEMLLPIAVILEKTDFWKDQKNGFTAFLKTDFFVWFTVDHNYDERVVVSDRFRLNPLLKTINQLTTYIKFKLTSNEFV